MLINLIPQRRDDSLKVIKDGDVLTINGQELDFTVVPEGATLPADAISCEWVVGDVERNHDALRLTLLLPLGPEASEAARFPDPIVNPADGELELPK